MQKFRNKNKQLERRKENINTFKRKKERKKEVEMVKG